MSQEIKAIETHYDGYRFRSRLEARWAVFFNAVGLEYEYEKEGFELSRRYLPDFWLPQLECWIEIKGEHITERDITLCKELAEHTDTTVYLIEKLPSSKPFAIYFPREYEYETGHLSRDCYWVESPCCRKIYIDDSTLNNEGYFNYGKTHWCTCLFLYSPTILIHKDNHFLEECYKLSKMARFEHGEIPSTEKHPDYARRIK